MLVLTLDGSRLVFGLRFFFALVAFFFGDAFEVFFFGEPFLLSLLFFFHGGCPAMMEMENARCMLA